MPKRVWLTVGMVDRFFRIKYWKPNMKVTSRMLTDFRYNQSEFPFEGQFIEI